MMGRLKKYEGDENRLKDSLHMCTVKGMAGSRFDNQACIQRSVWANWSRFEIPLIKRRAIMAKLKSS